MNRIKHIVFDFDGTIADSKAVFILIFNRLAEKYGLNKITPENLSYLQGLSSVERFKYLGLPLYKLPVVLTELFGLYGKSIDQVPIIKDMKPVMTELYNKGFTLAIISSNSKKNILQFLNNNHLQQVNRIYCSSNIFGKDKVIRKFLKTYHLKAEETIYIGDEQRDIDAARKNGLKVIWVPWGYDAIKAVETSPPDYIAQQPTDLLSLMDEQPGRAGITTTE